MKGLTWALLFAAATAGADAFAPGVGGGLRTAAAPARGGHGANFRRRQHRTQPPAHLPPAILPARYLPSLRGGALHAAIPAPMVEAFQSSGVQKILELACIAALGAFLRDTLDPGAMTKMLLSTLVPAAIMSSLASLQLSLELGTVALAGLLLLALQILTGTIAANVIVKVPSELASSGAPPDGPTKRRQAIRRTAAVQLGTMAPATSVFSFTREFAGPSLVGFAALADMPSKAYMLIFLPAVSRATGASTTL